jgi:exopolysaccharide biosynthesis operon protein EpsL
MKDMFKKILPLLAAAAVSPMAQADPEDSLNLVAGVGVLHDSNLFRRSSGKEESEQILSVSAGLKVNKAYSLQRFIVDAVLTDYRYQNHSNFDYVGKNLNAAWQWSLTPFLHGNLSASRNESLSSFVDYIGSSPNMRTVDTYRFDAEWEAAGRWRLVGGLNHLQRRNSQLFLAEGDYDASAAEAGVKYQMPSGSSLTLMGRQLQGEYARRVVSQADSIDSGFDQRDVELKLVWPMTGKSRLTGRLAHISREHDNFSVRDFSGPVGQLDYSWDVGGKLRFNVGLKQDLASYQTNDSSYYRLRGFNLSPVWQLSSKIALRARYSQDRRDYRGGLLIGLSERSDMLRTAQLAIDWMPLRTVVVSAYLQQDSRSSNRADRDFKATIGGINANYSF